MNDHVAMLLALTGALWAALAAVGGFCLKRLSDKIDALVTHREGCFGLFAEKRRAEQEYARLSRRIDDHEGRLARLEQEGGCPRSGGRSRR